MSASKLDQLRELMRSFGSCLVAYSGGVDSVFLARVARDVLGPRSLAAIADSASLPRRELEEALAIAERFQIPVRVVRTDEFSNPDYLSNPVDRCYFCKHELFTELEPLAKAEGFAVIAYGENASDAGDFRPGARAAREFQVRAPLKEVGLTKMEIRALSAQLGLPTADKPQMACLSSRIPHGETVSPEKLRMIEQAENILRDLGFYDVRVRHHELSSGFRVPGSGLEADRSGFRVSSSELEAGRQPETRNSKPETLPSGQPGTRNPEPGTFPSLARIEVGGTEMGKLFADNLAGQIVAALRKIGYAHVTLDLQGYRPAGGTKASREAGQA